MPTFSQNIVGIPAGMMEVEVVVVIRADKLTPDARKPLMASRQTVWLTNSGMLYSVRWNLISKTEPLQQQQQQNNNSNKHTGNNAKKKHSAIII